MAGRLHAFSRTELLIGREALEKLGRSKVAVFGIGGVGTYAVEGLVRAGVGHFVLVDDDRICLTNLNRQLHATRKTIGHFKVDAMKERILEINPAVEVETHQRFYMPEAGEELVRPDYDYLVDAIDTVTAKIDLVMRAKALRDAPNRVGVVVRRDERAEAKRARRFRHRAHGPPPSLGCPSLGGAS